MASPQTGGPVMTPRSGRALSLTPGARILQSPLTDETIWKRLKEAGFDEESIKRRDKAALIGYIAKLEAEIFEHQHQMGLLLMERKELTSKYEQIKASSETVEILSKRDQAAHLTSLAEARKKEEGLKKVIGVKEECIASLEKALHEMRAECAETKVAAECKLAEACSMMEGAQKKFTDAEVKLHAAESMQIEANRFRHVAERKLHEVEAREDDLRRRIETSKSDCDEKEKEIIFERQSLSERQKALQQEQDRLLDAKALLNQREDYIFSRSQELNQLQKELENTRRDIEMERRAINAEKSNLELTEASLRTREEALSKREAVLNEKEQQLVVLRENLESKESNEIQKAVSNHEIEVRTRKYAFDAELEMMRKSVEDELEAKRRAWELREVDLRQKEDLLQEREHDLEVQSRALMAKEKDVAEMSNLIDEKEKSLRTAEKEFELNKILLQREKEEIIKMKLELDSSLNSLEDKRQQLDCAKEKFEVLKTEKSELSILETKLKEEIDSVRAQKLQLMDEAAILAAEKAKFELEWEGIDEKREELRKEAERVADERLAFTKFIKDEHDSLRQEKDDMRDQYKRDVESLCREREDFMNKMAHERSEWFNKMQQERADFLLDIEMRRRELESCIDKKHEELESSWREKEMAFEQEKKNELQNISSLKEKVAKESEQVASEMKRLETERIEINLDREQRNQEWAELNNAIEELKVQREKLKKQRELLHGDREEILAQIEYLNKLENVKLALDSKAVAEIHQSNSTPSHHEVTRKKRLKQPTRIQDADFKLHNENNGINNMNKSDSASMLEVNGGSSPSSARFSWIKRCSDLIFGQSSEKLPLKYEDCSQISHHEDASLRVARQLDQSGKHDRQKYMGNKSPRMVSRRRPPGSAFEEPKVIVEVPTSGKVAKGVGDEINEAANEKDAPEQGFQAGRKRRADKPSNRYSDPPQGQRQNIKKRKQQHDDDVNASEQAVSHRAVLQQASKSSDQTHLGAEETTVLVVDKIIKVSEVTCEKVETYHGTDQDELAVKNFVMELDQGIHPDGESGHLNCANVQKSAAPLGPEAQEKIQEVHLGNVGEVTE
ncbi:protein CROWDED NUCLEI 4 [Ziziphus jujuba]|uniref:Protein CROWDED NUCLEI 4 n=1 Tax=Ziziphus jujuba TaxID=326968 RepID=A0ABM3ISU9_ZIZJJ|nr:protein CROWDED NUCLEI 4 [Ziziphus jujuba]